MNTDITETIRERVRQIEVTPSIPAIFHPLLKLLNSPPDEVNLDEVIKVASYDSAIAAQCLRVASSPLFGQSRPPDSMKAAIISLGLRRVETIVLTCCMGQAFAPSNWVLDPTVFWRHSLGCAMVCRKFSEKIKAHDHEKAYMAGLLHDIGFIVNSMSFGEQFSKAVAAACEQQIPLHEAELQHMGFTHCETGRALGEAWNLSGELIQVIAYHHQPENSETGRGLVALVHLCDLLCRVRGLDYGYYESSKVDLVADPAWEILQKTHRELQDVELARFTVELDEDVRGIYELVSTIFGSPRKN